MKINLKRLMAAGRYLLWANSPLKWRVSKGECPLCGSSLFIHMRPDAFMSRCLRCSNNVTNLSIVQIIKDIHSHENDQVWEMSTYGATFEYLKKNFNNFISSEYIHGIKSGEIVDNVLVQDATNTSFASNTFSLITSNQVFEHISDDLSAYKECFRILKPGGYLIFNVPLYNIPNTKQIAKIVNDEIIFEGKPEYHSSRIEGYRSVPTFWHHSINDIGKRLENFGFLVEIRSVIVSDSQKIAANVICCRKSM